MIELLQRMIDIPSLSYEEEKIGRFLFGYLQEKGFTVTKQPVSGNRFNLLARTDQEPHILFNTHLDTVPPYIPFQRQGDIIYGRGACDAKGQLVTILQAADRLLQENIRNFGILLVVGEEVDSDGAKQAAFLDLPSKYVIIGEPTENKLVIGQKGTLVFRIKAKGVEGHSCHPDNGSSAIHHLLSYLNTWLETDWGSDPFFGETSVNIGKIAGGSGMNVFAGSASAEGIFRVGTGLETIKQKIQQQIDDAVEFKVLSESEPQRLKQLDGFETAIVGFGTDASYLRPLGEILLLGPGSINYAHCDNEQIKVDEITTGVNLFVKMVKQLV